MTARQIYEAMLVELNKVEAPSLLLEDYNYFLNKAISQYINLNYGVYDMDQQRSDNLRVLKDTAFLTPVKVDAKTYGNHGLGSNYNNIWEVTLPQDYYHILNCMVTFKVKQSYSCYNQGTVQEFPARRLTADIWPLIVNNAYMCPSYKRPYFYIHNVNDIKEEYFQKNPYYKDPYMELVDLNKCTDPEELQQAIVQGKQDSFYDINEDGGVTIADYNELLDRKQYNDSKTSRTPLGSGTDPKVRVDKDGDHVTVNLSGLSRNVYSEKIKDPRNRAGNPFPDQVEHYPGMRYGNSSAVRMEIRYGKDSDTFEPISVQVDYLRTPQYIRLTQEQLDKTQDTSQIMEFPDYVCQEIINGLVKLVMENASDPRLQTNIPINQTIAPPAQQQQSSK